MNVVYVKDKLLLIIGMFKPGGTADGTADGTVGVFKVMKNESNLSLLPSFSLSLPPSPFL